MASSSPVIVLYESPQQRASRRLIGHLAARKATVPALHRVRDALLAQSPACTGAPWYVTIPANVQPN
jgi:hypothetical protein